MEIGARTCLTHMIGLESLVFYTDIRIIKAPVKPLPDFFLPPLSVSLI